MCFRDMNNVKLIEGDIVEKDGQKYIIVAIQSYSCATVAITEHLITKKADTFLLQDVKKI